MRCSAATWWPRSRACGRPAASTCRQWVARWKRTGQVTPRAPKGVFWALFLIVPFVLIIHFGVIRREERYLLARFGAPFADYMKRVPRYIWGI